VHQEFFKIFFFNRTQYLGIILLIKILTYSITAEEQSTHVFVHTKNVENFFQILSVFYLLPNILKSGLVYASKFGNLFPQKSCQCKLASCGKS